MRNTKIKELISTTVDEFSTTLEYGSKRIEVQKTILANYGKYLFERIYGLPRKEYEELNPHCSNNLFYVDCWDKSGVIETKTIRALNIENAKIIFESKYPDYKYDEPY